MSEVEDLVPPIEIEHNEPVAAELTPEPVAELPDLVYEYQPTDEDGRPMGGKQVIKYKTADELPQKLVEQNTLILRKLREVSRKNRLGIVDKDTIPEDIKRFPKTINLSPKELSPEERVKLSRDILDPERFEEAQDEVFESRFGAKPAQFRDSYNEMQERLLVLAAKQEVNEFLRANPDYYVCEQNRQTLVNWLAKNNLDIIKENLQLAYDTLREYMVTAAPLPSPPPPQPQPVAVDDSKEPPAEPTPAPKVVPIASGLTKNQSSDTRSPRTPGDDIVYELVNPITKAVTVYKGLKAIEVMPAEEFKNRVNRDPNFAKKIELLERQASRVQRPL